MGTPGTHEGRKRTRGGHFSRHDRQVERRSMLRSVSPPPPQQETQRGLPRTRGWPSSDYAQRTNYKHPYYSKKYLNKTLRGQANGWEGETRRAVPKHGRFAAKTPYYILSFRTFPKTCFDKCNGFSVVGMLCVQSQTTVERTTQTPTPRQHRPRLRRSPQSHKDFTLSRVRTSPRVGVNNAVFGFV